MTTQKIDSLTEAPALSGKLKLTLGGKDYHLRRPTIGEQWAFDESYATVIEREREDLEWAKAKLAEAGHDVDSDEPATVKTILALVRNVDPVESAKRKRVRQEALLDWWMQVFTTLDAQLPADLQIDALPVFLTDFANVGMVQAVWSRNPQDPGGE